ncbi:MAG: hypothetical protein HKO59_18115 [Phycisphaerales bacterium]|nr:hypothetical protein [Phycisphaerae bacterium]NNF43562.1 hypothetical protein [Phycisphaerales bacterium]NNM27854.1 hypothetical protein [Phycisphaerales bacterium]
MTTDTSATEPSRAALHDLQTKALATAQRFVDYEGYEQSETRAVSALARRCPEFTKDECRSWFLRAVEVHRAGIDYVRAHATRACELYENRQPLDEIAESFIREHAAFPRDLAIGVLMWVVFWHHMK